MKKQGSRLPLAGITPQAEAPRPIPTVMAWEGSLMTSFSLVGSVHFSLECDQYDARATNEFLQKGKRIRVTAEVLDAL
ncbi:MAG: hypothetical protein WC291_08020 [Thermodesulfovibrionales bacterium]|jgi:hypothetical protein